MAEPKVYVDPGRRFPAAELIRAANGNRRIMVEALGGLVADLLPADYQGVFAADRREAEVRRIAARLAG